MGHEVGLSSQQAQILLDKFGFNEIKEKSKQSIFSLFFSQFASILVFLLIIASGASIFLGDLLDGTFILLIVALNGFLGFFQEYQAEKAIAALKKMTISNTRVIRDGAELRIDSKLLVPGDVILLEEGDKIPADCKLLESIHLETNESSLTGESMSVEKSAQSKEKCEIYLGTIVIKGRGKALVLSTGMQTCFGKIATSLSQIQEEQTPLQKKIKVLGTQLGFLALGASGLVFIIGVLGKTPILEVALASISLAVAAVPEGLPAVITITLAVGMHRMARKKAILRKLSSIEALGGATIIATDKTGTLTRNEMRVEKIWLEGKNYVVSDSLLSLSHKSFNRMLTAGIICNNASLIFKHDHGGFDVLGDTTEGALLVLASQKNVLSEQVKLNGKLVEEYRFDPVLKLMTVIWKDKTGEFIYTKGAPEMVLGKSTSMMVGGIHKKIDDKQRQEIEKEFQEYAAKGSRIMALAYRPTKHTPTSRQEAEKGLTFIGFVGIADPVREEVKAAIALASQAGIKTIMITGDNELTANSIASQIGLINKNEEIITGEQFNELSDEQALQRLSNIRVFARTTPDQKLRIVTLLQQMGHIVVVTGDGVNDALALKQANVGVAMGITGTDVAKEAADMVITDDNYASLVTAISEGRTIFDNIKSAIKYLVGCNIGEIIAVVVGMLLGWPLIFTPLQLLYINLVTDGLPAIALAVSPGHESVMKKGPRVTKNMFEKLDFLWFFEVSLLTASATLIAFFVGYKASNLELARTLAFTTITLAQPFIMLDLMAKNNSLWKEKIYVSKIFLIAFISPVVLQLIIIYVPFFSQAFKAIQLSIPQLIFVVLLSMTLVLSSEIRKSVILKNMK